MKKCIPFVFILFIIFGCKKTDIQETIILPELEIPIVKIQTKNNQTIVSKTEYIDADLSILGLKKYENFKERIKIKGRGNTTWAYNKKPYHIEFINSVDLFSLGSDKDWLLIANYLDKNHILNATAFTIAEVLQMPFTPKFKPVEVQLNGSFLGLYLLTEQIEKEKTRVNIDEKGLILELDKYYNDFNKFRSKQYSLPINIKYPKVLKANDLNNIKESFDEMESSVFSTQFPNTNYTDLIDIESLCNFMIVSYLTDNQELNHPKSVFMHKNETGKFNMGPVWDFDWAFSYKPNSYFISSSNELFWKSSSEGTRFFSRFFLDPKFKSLFKTKWEEFRATKYGSVIEFIDVYSKAIEKSRNSDNGKWFNTYTDYPSEISRMKSWMNNRAYYVDNMVKDW